MLRLALFDNHDGGPCGVSDAAIALFVTNDHDRVRSGFAEAWEDQIHMQEGRGQVDRRTRWLILCTTISSVIGVVQRLIERRRSFLAYEKSDDIGRSLVMQWRKRFPGL